MKEKTRVLHLVGVMDCGGTENMLMAILRHIDRERFEFSFLVHSNDSKSGYFDDEIRRLGVDIHYIGSQRKLGLWRYLAALRKAIRSHGPFDVVHSHQDWLGGVAALGARLAGVPRRVVHIHTARLSSDGPFRRMAFLVQKLLVRCFATDCCGCSEKACQFLFGRSRGYRVIPNAIDLNRYRATDVAGRDECRAEWGCRDGTLVLIHAGSFNPNKNQHFLIEVASCMKPHIDFKLILAGDVACEYGKRAKQMVLKLGLASEVLFLGVQRDLPRVYSGGDVFLFPSKSEGFGIVAVEAQAAGLPCLLSRGVPEDVDMGIGLTHWIDDLDPAVWADTIAHANLERRRDGVSQAIRERGFDVAQSVRMIQQLY